MADVGLELIEFTEAEIRRAPEFPLSYKEFHAYRAGLPWLRRALLFYKSPNSRARAMKFTFQLYLWTTVFGSAAIPLAYLLRDLISAAVWPTAPWILNRNGWDVFLDAHPIACGILFYAYAFGIISFYRRRSIRYESHPSYFPRDRELRRFFEDSRGLQANDPYATCPPNALVLRRPRAGRFAFSQVNHWTPPQTRKPPGRRAVTELRVVAELLFFRRLTRAGDVLAFPQPQSRDWGYPMPPADAG